MTKNKANFSSPYLIKLIAHLMTFNFYYYLQSPNAFV